MQCSELSTIPKPLLNVSQHIDNLVVPPDTSIDNSSMDRISVLAEYEVGSDHPTPHFLQLDSFVSVYK